MDRVIFMNRILLVEDDEALSYGVEFALRSEGLDIVTAGSLGAAKGLIDDKFDLILLDVKLPDGSGYEMCREIREKTSVPIIFLTACDEEVNIVMGLDMGADDYITKPFRIRELISRIKAVLRRSRNVDGNMLSSGDICVNTLDGKVKKGSEEVILTALEYRLLLTFMNSSKKILSRNLILENLWDAGGEFVDDNTLSVYIRRLREKIEDNPAEPRYIVTCRGLGYKWDAGVRRSI
jgi:Response regulators consisting of a CheY-like receiver domain and a winged-helix DNA-binding domain